MLLHLRGRLRGCCDFYDLTFKGTLLTRLNYCSARPSGRARIETSIWKKGQAGFMTGSGTPGRAVQGAS